MTPARFTSPGGLLPPHGSAGRWIGVVVAILCFLACLGAIAAAAGDRAAHGWARRLGSEATVQVRPAVGETGPAAAARAAEILAGVDGVSEARALGRDAAEDLIRPWVGDAVLDDLPLPYLVTVRLDPEAPASAVSLSRALSSAGLDASVDDHSLWRGDVERSAATVTVLAVLAFLLTAGAAGAAVVYATRAGMAADAELIRTLGLLGATDGLIAGLYQKRFALLAGLAGLGGTAAAALLAAGLRLLGGSDGASPALPIAWGDILLISPCPLIAATVAFAAARLAARTALVHSARLNG